jgi:hypothetical protein
MNDPEFLKALELVAEYDRNRPKLVKEFRLYYNNDGSIIGMWETNHPEGQYIVLDDVTQFHTTSTLQLRVVDGKLTKIEIGTPQENKLVKSNTGQPVVAGHAALALKPTETYSNIEYYDRKTNN